MLVPEIHLERAEKELASARAHLKKARRKKRKWRERALNATATATATKLRAGDREARGREIDLLLRLEAEVRKAGDPLSAHQYSPRELQHVLDCLDCVRVRDVVPAEKPDPGPPPVKEEAPSEPAVRLIPS